MDDDAEPGPDERDPADEPEVPEGAEGTDATELTEAWERPIDRFRRGAAAR